jgi:alpha-tubulin suppressor-like RCC1 family protein
MYIKMSYRHCNKLKCWIPPFSIPIRPIVTSNIFAWGNNTFGQLGNGNNVSSDVPVLVDTSGVLRGKLITQVSSSIDGFSLALSTDGLIYSWGSNSSGQLGNGTNINSNIPVAVNTSGVLNGKFITQISTGLMFSVALASNATVYTWGVGANGQLGNGTNINSNVPVAVNMSGVLAGKTITKIAAGENHVLVLSSDGKVYSWGNNSSGQLGNGTNISSNVPVGPVDGLLNGKTIVDIAAGNQFSLALDSNGIVYA